MANLDKIIKMQGDGLTDLQIIEVLRNEGISPREITNLLSQARIKAVVKNEENMEVEYPEHPKMQKSIMPREESEENFSQTQGTREDISQEYQEKTPDEIPSSYNSSTEPEQYDQNAGYQDYPATGENQEYSEYIPQNADIETISDIAEQIIEEKTEKLKKQISSLSSFKEDIGMKVETINERLDKLEKNFSDLQIAIIGKIGDYGKDINDISKEMKMTQTSFAKVIDPLVDNINELREITKSLKNKEEFKDFEVKN